MDQLRSNQITDEQKIILKYLAESVAKKGVQFLEIGSWLGDSTIVLGKVAQKHKGTLVCVDWWKGNPGTGLEVIASQNDIFSKFWERICNEGLEDTIIPIRARSEEALKHLKPNSYHLIFIDGDHRYQQTLLDINSSKDLVSDDGGILCGHDCEGYRSDFDEDFLEEGKEIDYHQTVHCGVVLAVSSVFDEYSINYSIWSTTFNGRPQKWKAINLDTPNIAHRKQSPPIPFALSNHYHYYRFGRYIYAILKETGHIDVYPENPNLPSEVPRDTTINGIQHKTKEKVELVSDHPILLINHKQYNLIQHNNRYIALHHSLGIVNMPYLSKEILQSHHSDKKLFVSNSVTSLKKQIDFHNPSLEREDYRQYNIIFYRDKYYAVPQSIGPIRDWNRFNFRFTKGRKLCFVANSYNNALALIDQHLKGIQ